jgi:predicted PurR-regulated permease PerM
VGFQTGSLWQPPAAFHLAFLREIVTVQRQRALDAERPVPIRRPERSDGRCSIGPVSASGSPRLIVPRWIQLVTLPLVLVLVWWLASAAGQIVFLFLVAALIALLLDPLVRALQRVRLPRGLSVAIVYLAFAAALGLVILGIATAVVSQTKTAANRFNDYFSHPHAPSGQTSAYLDVNRLQHWLNTHHLRSIKVEKQGHKIVNQIRRRDVGKYTHRIVTFVEGAAISIGKTLFATVLLFVVSIYMLLDMQRLGRAIDRRFPPRPGEQPLLITMQTALLSYVRGQIALSLIIGTSAGIGLWVLGAVGLLPHGQKYALLLGAWVAVTEVIPYLGPWLGAVPAVIYALVVHPISAVWVILLFLGIHQIEGHVVVPNVMGSALRLHPLLVIFGLAAGFEIYGLAGALVALPVLAVSRAVWEFFADRIQLESWAGSAAVPVEVEPVEPGDHA